MSVQDCDLIGLLRARFPPTSILHFSCEKESERRFTCFTTVLDEQSRKTHFAVECSDATLLKAKMGCARQLLSSICPDALEKRENSFDSNYWVARNGEQELRHLEQLFSLLLIDHLDIFEVVNIYSRLRNDQYESLAQFVREKTFGEQILWFLQMLIDNTTDFAKTTATHHVVLSADALEHAIRLRDRVLSLLSASGKRNKLTLIGKLFVDDGE